MPEAPVRVWGSRPRACRELMPTSSDGRFGHARGFGHRASAPVSKSVGFSRCPQAPSAFIKLIVQGAIFGSNYLDCIIILHAQNLSDQTSAVNKNDRLFIYTSLELGLNDGEESTSFSGDGCVRRDRLRSPHRPISATEDGDQSPRMRVSA